MGNKRANDGGEPMSSKKLQRSKRKKDPIVEDVSLTIDANDNGVEDGGFGEVEESLQRDASNDQGDSEATGSTCELGNGRCWIELPTQNA